MEHDVRIILWVDDICSYAPAHARIQTPVVVQTRVTSVHSAIHGRWLWMISFNANIKELGFETNRNDVPRPRTMTAIFLGVDS